MLRYYEQDGWEASPTRPLEIQPALQIHRFYIHGFDQQQTENVLGLQCLHLYLTWINIFSFVIIP